MKKNGLLMVMLSSFITGTVLFGRTWTDAGIELLSKNDYKKAIIAFEKAIYDNPHDSTAYENEAKAYEAIGDISNAADYYAMANFLAPSQRLKNINESIYQKTFGLGACAFYPFTFEIMGDLHYNSPEHDGGNERQPLWGFTFGGIALMNYSINHWLAVTSGALYVREGGTVRMTTQDSATFIADYIDIPVAVKFKFKLPFSTNFSGYPDAHAFSIGGYFGYNVMGYFSSMAYNVSGIPAIDRGFYASYETYLRVGNIFLVSSLSVLYSFMPIYPGSTTHVLNGLLAFGIGF